MYPFVTRTVFAHLIYLIGLEIQLSFQWAGIVNTGFLIPNALEGITMTRMHEHSRAVYGVFPLESCTKTGKLFLAFKSTLPISFSYTFGISKIPSGDKSNEIIWIFGGSTSVPIPKEFFKQIVYLRLEFQHPIDDVNSNIRAVNVPEEDSDNSGIRYDPPLIPEII
jgi:hypothetical protein